ncbi:MAG: hypothetical protein AAFU80_24640 [Pseudomonadota bacterium]
MDDFTPSVQQPGTHPIIWWFFGMMICRSDAYIRPARWSLAPVFAGFGPRGAPDARAAPQQNFFIF